MKKTISSLMLMLALTITPQMQVKAATVPEYVLMAVAVVVVVTNVACTVKDTATGETSTKCAVLNTVTP